MDGIKSIILILLGGVIFLLTITSASAVANITIDQFTSIKHSSTNYTFEVKIDNTGDANISNASWKIEAGDGNLISGVEGVFLNTTEHLHIIADYSYANNSRVEANASVAEGLLTDSKTIVLGSGLNVFGLAAGNSTNLDEVFEFEVNNTGAEVEAFNWTFETGDETIEGLEKITLNSGEELFSYIEHSYAAAGNYTVFANASGRDVENISVEINAPEVVPMRIDVFDASTLGRENTKRVMQFIVENNGSGVLEVIEWTFNLPDDLALVKSVNAANLSQSEKLFVFVGHNFSTFKAQGIQVNVTNVTDIGSDASSEDVQRIVVENYAIPYLKNGTQSTAVYRFSILNLGNSDLIEWQFKESAATIISAVNTTLNTYEHVQVFVEYESNSSGVVEAVVSANNGSLVDQDALNITIG